MGQGSQLVVHGRRDPVRIGGIQILSQHLIIISYSMALELGLHHHPPAGLPERERLNRTRTWLNLFCVDGAHATMFGKQPMSSLNDVVSRSSFNWYKASALTLPYDIHLCGYVDILYIMTRFRDTVGHDPIEKAGQVRSERHFFSCLILNLL